MLVFEPVDLIIVKKSEDVSPKDCPTTAMGITHPTTGPGGHQCVTLTGAYGI